MRNPVARASHLVRRFFGHVGARPLSPSEQDRVRAHLPDGTASLFFSQVPADQRHALHVLDRLLDTGIEDADATAAALLHDVGKATTTLGPIRRSLATVLGALRIPVPRSWRGYLNHGEVGARLLEEAGAPHLAIAFTRHHPGPPPEGIDPAHWRALAGADDA